MVSDFYRFYGLEPDCLFDMGFAKFWMLLMGLGDGARWVSECHRVQKNGKGDRQVSTGHKVAETEDEMRAQWALVGAQLLSMG